MRKGKEGREGGGTRQRGRSADGNRCDSAAARVSAYI